MRLLTTFIRRVVYACILLIAVLVLNFMLIHLAPGDPADVIAGEMGGATEEILAEIRATYGLDKPISEQLLVYLGKVARGDLGYSFYFNKPVTDLILQRVGATILLVITALVLAVYLGTFLGVVASKKPTGYLSHFVTILSLLGYSAPVFWTGMMLLILFASWLPILPVSGMYNVALEGGRLARTLDILHHLILPMLTLGIIYLAQYSRLARASMLDVLGSDYIRTARAKGAGESRVLFAHAMRNSLAPVVTILALRLGFAFGGTVVIETVFSYPGLGRLMFEAVGGRDFPVMQAGFLLITIAVLFFNLIADFMYQFLDPRTKGQ